MAAPKGNRFWERRAKHGRDALFADSDKLWEAATEYFTWCDENPWVKVEQLRKPYVEYDKDGNVIATHLTAELPTSRPYTLSGLCLYLNCDQSYFRQLKASKDLSKDFYTVITRIEETMWTQKFEGATVGAFNASIIARELGLADKKEHKVTGTHHVRRDDESGDIIIDNE